MADPNLQGALAGAAILEKLQTIIPDLAPLFGSVPELRPLFIKLLPPPIGESMATDKFANELHKTNWWRTTPESARLWLATTTRDPAQANRQRQQTINQYYDIAAQQGISVPVNNMYLLAEAGLRQGWDQNEIARAILEQAHGKDPLAGTLDATATQLRQIATQWGVPYGHDASFEEAKKIAGGRGSVEGFSEQMRQHAKSLFPAWAEQIENGDTVQNLSEPYRQLAATTLEINPAEFNLQDSKWRRLLQQKNEKGAWHPMTIADAESEMMVDPRYGWDRTKGARAAAVDLVDQLGQAFGSRA